MMMHWTLPKLLEVGCAVYPEYVGPGIHRLGKQILVLCDSHLQMENYDGRRKNSKELKNTKLWSDKGKKHKSLEMRGRVQVCISLIFKGGCYSPMFNYYDCDLC